MKTLQYEGKNIRVSEDENKRPIFVAKDIANAIGYIDSINAIKQHVSPENKHYRNVQTIQGKQKMTIITKKGVNQLILSSRLNTYSFKKWLDENVYHIEYVEAERYEVPKAKLSDRNYVFYDCLKQLFPYEEIEINKKVGLYIVDIFMPYTNFIFEVTNIEQKQSDINREIEIQNTLKAMALMYEEDEYYYKNHSAKELFPFFYIEKGKEFTEIRNILLEIENHTGLCATDFMKQS